MHAASGIAMEAAIDGLRDRVMSKLDDVKQIIFSVTIELFVDGPKPLLLDVEKTSAFDVSAKKTVNTTFDVYTLVAVILLQISSIIEVPI
jgi:ABC-type iron transport system FetAB ATPase subunit